MRDLAQACGVRMNTIQHHFGSKPHLYEEILRRWDEEIESLVARVLAGEQSEEGLVAQVVGELFDLYLARRDRVAISARAVLGEGLPARNSALDPSWVGFMSSEMRARKIGTPGLDLRLLFITIEGILNNHALSMSHYQRLFGRDVTDRELAAKTKAHLRRVILAILGSVPGAREADSAGKES